MRLRKRHSLIAGPLGAGAAIVFAAVSLAAEPEIEAKDSPLSWSPTTATVSSGESVKFKNPSASLPHGVTWQAGAPACTNVPVAGQTNWSGSCTFTQPGSYPFVCTVHPSYMTGSVTVTGVGAPTTTTGAGSPTSDTEATLQGSVNPNGLETKYFFKYGTTTSYGETTGKTVAGEGMIAVAASAGVTGLSPGTTYHFRLFAENTSGTTQGVDHAFTTPGPPLATTSTATAVGTTEATLRGSVNPRGHATTYFFKWGETASYGEETSVKSAGSGTGNTSVTAPLTGLSPATTYHFRLFANNVSGDATGSDQTFTTSSTSPPPPPDDPLPAPITPVLTPPPPVTLPDTKITLKPAAKTKDRTPTFKFKSTVAGATFKCTLDAKALKPCRSPLTTKTLSFGRHTLKVGAVVGGGSDPTPTAFSFKVLKP